ncbi:hypothetical protein DITRI_Ditri12bG0179500 [Diplodiscus trichospermus]
MEDLFQGKSVDMAFSLWHHVLEKAFKPNVTMHNTVIHGLCSAGKVEDALQLYSKISQRNYAPNLAIYNTLMEFYFSFGGIARRAGEDGLSQGNFFKGIAGTEKINKATKIAPRTAAFRQSMKR